MKRKILSIFLAASITMMAFTGCGNKKVEYKVDGTTDATNAPVPTEGITDEWSTIWNETFKAVDSDGKDIDIEINARFKDASDGRLLDANGEGHIVVYYEELEINEALKKRVVEHFFKGNKVYKFDDDALTKKYLEMDIKELNDIKETIKGDPESEDYLEYIAEKLEQINQNYATAPDDWLEIEDYSGNNFLSFVDGEPYKICFGTEENEFTLDSESFTHTTRFIRYSRVSSAYFDGDEETVIEEGTTTSTQAMLDLLRGALEDMGIEGVFSKDSLKGFIIEGIDTQGVEAENIECKVANYYGYQIGKDVTITAKNHELMNNNISALFVGNDIILFDITDPVKITGYETDIKILSPEGIKSAIKDILTTKKDKFKLHGQSGFGNKIRCEALWLEYIPYTSEDGRKAVIPVWNFNGLFYVNAIDGTPIYRD